MGDVIGSRMVEVNEVRIGSRVVWIRVLLDQFRSPIILILFLAGFLSLLIGEVVDGLMVMLAVMVNVVLGFFQEYKAGKILEELSRLITIEAKVKRGESWMEVDSKLLVKGDVVRLEIGRTVPADGRIIVSNGLYLNEAVLSGESVPVEKGEGKEVFMGTVVERGIGEMVVEKIGLSTKMGEVAEQVGKERRDQTPLQKKLLMLSRQLVVFIGIVILVVIVDSVLSGREWREVFTISVALAVTGLPEGLVVSLMLILTVAMRKILKGKAVVRKMLAAETLGSVDVVCLDKTGTITEGRMKAIDGQVCGGEEEMQAMIRGAILCNDMRDPLEVAMDVWARQKLGDEESKRVDAVYKRVSELPFDPRYKYIVTRHKSEKDGVNIEFLSGAPEVVLDHCDLRSEIVEEWKNKFKELGGQGYRLVGFADKETKDGKEISRESISNYRFLGVVIYEDPVRVGVVEMISKMKLAGVVPRVITGDYKETAWAVAKQAGIVGGEIDDRFVMVGEELESLSEEDLLKRISEVMVFARTTPLQKLKIVSSLQSKGLVVAMTGDGVNDAPALKQADIGIVVGEAMDIAKETADMVLMSNNFGTILTAIEEGRLVLVNLRRVVVYLLVYAFNGIFLILPAMFFGWPLPLTATQILLINLISDGFPYLALAFESKDGDLMSSKIKRRGIVERREWLLIILTSMVIGGLSLGFFGFNYLMGVELRELRSLTILTLGVVTLLMVFSLRNLDKPIWKSSFWSNKWLNLAVLFGLAMLFGVVYSPLGSAIFETVVLGGNLGQVGIVFLISLLMVELFKYRLFWKKER